MGEIFADDLQIVAEVVDGLARAEIQNRPAVGFPVIAVEAEHGGAGLEIADRVRRAVGGGIATPRWRWSPPRRPTTRRSCGCGRRPRRRRTCNRPSEGHSGWRGPRPVERTSPPAVRVGRGTAAWPATSGIVREASVWVARGKPPAPAERRRQQEATKPGPYIPPIMPKPVRRTVSPYSSIRPIADRTVHNVTSLALPHPSAIVAGWPFSAPTSRSPADTTRRWSAPTGAAASASSCSRKTTTSGPPRTLRRKKPAGSARHWTLWA